MQQIFTHLDTTLYSARPASLCISRVERHQAWKEKGLCTAAVSKEQQKTMKDGSSHLLLSSLIHVVVNAP